MKTLVAFNLDEQHYALYLSTVERIVRVVEVTPLPKAPDIALGIINVEGRIIPVLNVRKRFSLPEREIELSDQLIIANTLRRTVALVVDSVRGVIECSEHEVIPAKEVLPGMEYVEGVSKLGDGIILIHNLDKFLSLKEDKLIENAIKEILN